jgi:hypothetical protein
MNDPTWDIPTERYNPTRFSRKASIPPARLPHYRARVLISQFVRRIGGTAFPKFNNRKLIGLQLIERLEGKKMVNAATPTCVGRPRSYRVF